MVCYIINYILWVIEAIICSTIKCFAFEPKKHEKRRWKYIAVFVLLQLPIMTIKFVYAENDLIRNVCLVMLPLVYIIYLKRLFECYLWQAILLVVFEMCCSFMTEIIAQAILKNELEKYSFFSLNMPIVVLYVAIGYMILPILYLFVLFLFKRFVLKRSYNLRVFYIFSIFPISQIIMLFSINN